MLKMSIGPVYTVQNSNQLDQTIGVKYQQIMVQIQMYIYTLVLIQVRLVPKHVAANHVRVAKPLEEKLMEARLLQLYLTRRFV